MKNDPPTSTPSSGAGWPHFPASEIACRHCGDLVMHPPFMDRLERLRAAFAHPMPVTSGYRCPAHDATIGGAGVHPTGRAVDVALSGADLYRLLALALSMGFTGIGIHQRGPMEQRFIHLDDMEDGHTPRPRIWSYG
ncbi:MAG: D-Ala-D-Ala carboxypeptidase family metallohydrolase [Leptospirillia bacterium]